MGDEEHSIYCSLCPQSHVCCMTELEVQSCIQDPSISWYVSGSALMATSVFIPAYHLLFEQCLELN